MGEGVILTRSRMDADHRDDEASSESGDH